MRQTFKAWRVVFLFVLVLPMGLHGQTEIGNVTGVVVDRSGAVLPGAEIQVLNVGTNVKKTTNTAEGGEYNVPVSPGTYQVQVSLPGFKRHVRESVVVAAATTVRLDVNLGLRYEFTMPPVDLNNQYSDFTPDRPNPKVNGYPGALRFAGFCEGRENRRSLVPRYYGSIGPRIGLAFSASDKMVFRTAFGRSYSKVTVVSGSGHFAGFIGQYEFLPADNGVGSLYNWDNGLPSYPLPPQIDPSFSNNKQ